MNPDSKRSRENYRRALKKLREFVSTPITEDRDKAGIIQAFEYSFEICWKTIQKIVVAHSKTVGSPKQAFQAAFELGWIKEVDQDKWIKMVDDWNLAASTYLQALAGEVLGRIRSQHLISLENLLLILEKETECSDKPK